MKPAVCVVLVSPRNPLNIGAAARAMSNFGFDDLRLVNAYEVAFREAKSAVGADKVLKSAREFPGLGEAVADCTLVAGTTGSMSQKATQPLYALEQGAKRLRRRPGRTALVFGSEKHGLSNEDLSFCDWLLRIPSRPEHRSMNLGQAVAVCLYELIRNPRAPKPAAARKKPATGVQTELLVARLDDALHQSGYYAGSGILRSRLRLRSLVKRLDLSERDAVVLMGMLRQILWKLEHP
jgi:tRNA/rRNA methyltransferase